jgi:hypothetical protein
MKRIALLVLLLSVCGCISVVADDSAKKDEIVKLEPYVVTAKGEVYLQTSFRGHFIFAGMKALTFRSLPTSWKKAGIQLGDRVTKINGKAIYGMGLGEFLKFIEKTLPPPTDKTAPVTFEIQSKDSNRTWQFEFVQKVAYGITVGTSDQPPT